MTPITLWLLVYFLPMGLGFYPALRAGKSPKRALVVHAVLLVSIALLVGIGTRLNFAFEIVPILLLLGAIVFSFLLLKVFGLAYALSSLIQEACLLLAATLLIPATGLLVAAFLAALVYALAHLLDRTGWWWKVSVMLLWGMASILLYVWLGHPFVSLAIHIVGGTLLIRQGLLLSTQERLW